MPRARNRPAARRRHKNVLAQTKGHHGTRNRIFRRASESRLHALSYSYRDRRDRKADFRRLWIQRINAGARLHGLSYSQLVYGLRLAGVQIDRKVMADLAVQDPPGFKAVVDRAKAALPA